MSRYQLKCLARQPSGKNESGQPETVPFVMFGTVTATAKRHINRSIEKLREARVVAADQMGLSDHIHRGRLKRYGHLVMSDLTPDELDEKNKDTPDYKPFSTEDRAAFEAFPEGKRDSLGRWWNLREEFFHNHHAEICAILISSIHGSLELISDKWANSDWPELSPREMEAAIDQRTETLLFYLDEKDLDDMFEAANDHYEKAGLRNGQAGK